MSEQEHKLLDFNDPRTVQRFAEIGQMSMGLIHDLNNEMTTALGSLVLHRENYDQNDLNGKDNKELGMALESLIRMKDMLIRTLMMIRGNGIIREKISLPVILDLAIQRASNELLMLDIEAKIQKYYDENLPEMLLDRVLIDRAIANLISNCFHAMRENGKDCILWVSLCQDMDNAYIIIHDNGPGLPESVIENNGTQCLTTRQNHGGSGIGLTIVREIIEAHGGQIIIANGIVGGAKFIVCLPKNSTIVTK